MKTFFVVLAMLSLMLIVDNGPREWMRYVGVTGFSFALSALTDPDVWG